MNMKQNMTTSGLFFASISAVVGSGWLFGALYASKLAGPASLISWVIAGICIMMLAFILAELATLFPKSGGIISYVNFSHGNLTGFLLSWISWLSFVILTPIEVQASLEYASVYFPWIHTKNGTAHSLSLKGYILAMALMWVILYVNLMGVKMMAKTNKLITYWKIIIPVVVAFVFLTTSFHKENLGSTFEEFAPYGWQGIFSALSVGGVVFAYNGFQHIIMLSAETKNPQKSIPRAVFASLLAVMGIYLLLQCAFIFVLPPSDLLNGWSSLSFKGDSGPLVGMAALLGLHWLVLLLYFDAFLSPAGAGIVYTASTSRLVYAMSTHGYLPVFFRDLNSQGVPHKSLFFNFLIGLLLFFPFSGWQPMVAFLSAAILLSCAMAPISLVALRKQQPEKRRPFKLPFAKSLSLFGFYIANLMLYWTGWDNISKLILAIILGFLAFLVKSFWQKNLFLKKDFKSSIWLIPYLLGLGCISYLGTFGHGRGIMPFGEDFLVLFLFSTAIFALSQKGALSPKDSLSNAENSLLIYKKVLGEDQ
jgi:amino acid transporter